MFKIISGVVGLIGALWLGLAGGWAVWSYDRAPPGWPNWTVHAWVFHWTFHAPESLGAQLAAARGQVAAYASAEAAARAHATAVEARDASIGDQLAAADQRAESRIRTVTRTLVKEVPVAIPPTVDRSYPLPVGLLRVQSAAALGLDLSAIPAPAGLADDAPGPVAASAFGRLIAANDGACRADQQRLADLQALVRAEEAAHAR